MRAVLIFKLIRHLVRQIFRVMFAQNWLLTARARLALSSVNKSPRTGPPPCSPTICRRDEVSLDEVERILIPPFPGSNPGAPASQRGLCGVISGCVKTADIPAGSGRQRRGAVLLPV